jgi:hypothetical protein
MTEITGNTYPVRDSLKALGGKWDPEKKAWLVPDSKVVEARKLVEGGGNGATTTSTSTKLAFRYTKCQICGAQADRYTKIYRSGECRDCYEERKMGY